MSQIGVLLGTDYERLLHREKNVLRSGPGGLDWGNQRFLKHAEDEQLQYVDNKNKDAMVAGKQVWDVLIVLPVLSSCKFVLHSLKHRTIRRPRRMRQNCLESGAIPTRALFMPNTITRKRTRRQPRSWLRLRAPPQSCANWLPRASQNSGRRVLLAKAIPAARRCFGRCANQSLLSTTTAPVSL